MRSTGRARRGEKASHSAWRPLGVSHERERSLGGELVESSAVFLVGQECPFSCVFCDLWRNTLDERTPRGAIPRQLEEALEEIPHRQRIKLYNASNFFDDLAVPPEDDSAILELLAPFAEVCVECHPRLVGQRCYEFADRLAGRLEVAMGLETAHTRVLERLRKDMTVEDFDRAARELNQRDIGVRAFVLLGVPYLDPGEQLEWLRRSVEHAESSGAQVISIIPVRGGGGALEVLAREGDWTRTTLGQLERGLAMLVVSSTAVVQADTWDLAEFSDCDACFAARSHNIETMNLSGVAMPVSSCAQCDPSR